MALFPPREPFKKNPRADFFAEDFRRAVFEKGLKVTWEQCEQCPCGRKVNDVANDMQYPQLLSAQTLTGEAPPECTKCKGVGFFLHSAQTIPAIIQDLRNVARRFGHLGEYEEGSARATFLPEHKIKLGDRLTLQDSVIVVRENRRRGASGVLDALRFPIASQVQDLATGKTLVRTLLCQKADVNNLSSSTMTLIEGTDYVVSVDGKVDWTLGVANGKAPAAGIHYALSYYARPRYVVTDKGHNTRDTFTQIHAATPTFQTMPLHATVKLEYLGDKGGIP